MKVISRIMVKMPLSKKGERTRYEIELIVTDKLYHVLIFQYISGKFKKCEEVVCTKDKQSAVQYYHEELLILTSFL